MRLTIVTASNPLQVDRDQILQDLESVSSAESSSSTSSSSSRVAELVTVCSDAYTASKGSHAIVLCTEWDEFCQLDYAR